MNTDERRLVSWF